MIYQYTRMIINLVPFISLSLCDFIILYALLTRFILVICIFLAL
jgi:uncharacterized membrane protein